MVISSLNYSNIELVDGDFLLRLNNGTKINIFLYKFKRLDNCDSANIFDTNFDYDLVVLDKQGQNYLYFTYTYIDEPEEVF